MRGGAEDCAYKEKADHVLENKTRPTYIYLDVTSKQRSTVWQEETYTSLALRHSLVQQPEYFQQPLVSIHDRPCHNKAGNNEVLEQSYYFCAAS